MSDDFEIELKQGFLEEATQLLSESEQCFLELENNPQDASIIEKIFRIAHNVKGSSKAVGFSELGAYTHEFESFLLKIKNGQLKATPASISLLLEGNDHLRNFIDALKADLAATLDSSDLIKKFAAFKEEGDGAAASPAPAAPAEKAESFEGDISEAVAAEPSAETSAANPSAEPAALSPELTEFAELTTQNLPPPPAKEEKLKAPEKAKAPVSQADESIRVSLSRVERLVNLVGEAVILQTVMREQVSQNQVNHLRRTCHHLGKVMKEVQDLSMGLRMIPLKQTFQKMQRIVRDTSALLGKKVQLELMGEETEVDKTVLESLSDPLVHMIRNAVDHGIESNEKRLEAGKSPEGKVLLKAYHQSGRLIIEVKDDGGGIDGERLKQKALEKGLFTDVSKMTEKEGVHLIFHPGFSTKTEVTEVSGRGVGMDVVKTNIEALQGDITVTTKVGSGTEFRISLPLTLAIIDGMIVQSGKERFVIPLSHVHESVRLQPQDLRSSSTLGEMLLLRGENLPLYRLNRLLGRASKASNDEAKGIAIIVRSQEQAFATLVDDIIGQHQVVIKKVGAELDGVKGISGSAILGDGRPALILEVQDLLGKNRRAA